MKSGPTLKKRNPQNENENSYVWVYNRPVVAESVIPLRNQNRLSMPKVESLNPGVAVYFCELRSQFKVGKFG